MNNEKLRNTYLDIVKGIAIILVVIGHNIQYGSGINYFKNNLYFENVIFKFIYSFHMPLFMVISGYLFFYSLKKYPLNKQIKLKFQKLILPIIFWSFISILIKFVRDYSLWLDNGIIFILKSSIAIAIHNLWFLWAIFYCSIAILLVNKFFKDSIFAYLVIFILFFITPDKFNFFLYKFMFPYYLLGYFFNKHKGILFFQKIFNLKIKKIVIYTFVIIFYLLLFIIFNTDNYIYTTHINIFGKFRFYQIVIDLYRWLIGLIGTILVLMSVFSLYQLFNYNMINKFLSYCGKNSLVIYIMDNFINNYILLKVTANFNLNYFLIILEGVIILTICLIFNYIIKKNRKLSNILLGYR